MAVPAPTSHQTFKDDGPFVSIEIHKIKKIIYILLTSSSAFFENALNLPQS